MVAPALVLCGAVLTLGPAAVAEEGASSEPPRTASDVDGPLPRLGEVGPVTDAPEGLSLSPAVVEVPLQPGRRSEIVHVVANATEAPLRLRLDVAPATVGRDGPRPAGSSPSAVDDRATRLVLPADRLVLAAGEGAELRSTGEVGSGDSRVVALLATPAIEGAEEEGDHRTDAEDAEAAEDSEDAEHAENAVGDATIGGARAVAYVVLLDEAVPSGLRAAATEDAAPGTLAAIALAADRHAVVDVRVRVRSWLGVLHDHTVADLLVGPDEPRVLEVARPPGSPPGRLHLEVVGVDRTGTEARASVTTSAGAAGWLLVLAVALLLAAAATVVLAGRRLRSPARRPSSPPTDPPPAEEPDP
jgi:hypothetical protein